MRPTAIAWHRPMSLLGTAGKGERYRRGSWSAPTGGIRSAARPPALRSGAANCDQAALTFNISHSRPHREYLDRISHAAGTLRLCAAARRPLQRGVGGGAEGSRAADGVERRRIVGSCGSPQSHSILGQIAGRTRTTSVSTCDRTAPTVCQHRVSRWSAKPPMCCRRSARKVSIWDCAMPPIIADVVRDAMAAGEDPGCAVGARPLYNSARRPDVMSRTFAIDIANRSLLSDFLPMQSLRAAGLHLIGSFGPLRRIAMREGLAPSWRPSTFRIRRHGNARRSV